MMKYILLGHGSRHPWASSGFSALADATSRALNTSVAVAYLDLAEPSLLEVAHKAVRSGETHAVLTPALFTDAFHNRVDVPREVAEVSSSTGLTMSVTDTIGTGEDVLNILERVVAEDAPQGADIVLYFVGSSVPGADEAVYDVADSLGIATGRKVYALRASGRKDAGAQLVERASISKALHLVPLFVTYGLLLEKVLTYLPHIAEATGCRITHSGPLSARLAQITSARLSSIGV